MSGGQSDEKDMTGVDDDVFVLQSLTCMEFRASSPSWLIPDRFAGHRLAGIEKSPFPLAQSP
jgi:hypothetical protein